MIPDLKTVLTLRSLLAVALMLWCAGAGCMMVSYARAAANENAGSALMGDRMGGLTRMDGHACCKAKHPPAKTHQRAESKQLFESTQWSLLTIPSTPTQSGVMNCCPLTSGSVVVASRSQCHDRWTDLQPPRSLSVLLVSSDPLPLSVPLRLPNRAHSYLLDCAFLN